MYLCVHVCTWLLRVVLSPSSGEYNLSAHLSLWDSNIQHLNLLRGEGLRHGSILILLFFVLTGALSLLLLWLSNSKVQTETDWWKLFLYFCFKMPSLGLEIAQLVKCLSHSIKICHLPKKTNKQKLVCSYNHNAGEAKTDGSLGTLPVSLTCLLSMKFSDILSQKSRWKIPEEQHLKLTSSLHMLIHIHTLFPKQSKSRAPNWLPNIINSDNAWDLWL